MMKIQRIILATLILGTCSSVALAAEFTPLNFENATYTSGPKIAATATTTATTSSSAATEVVGSQNLQSAISQLDNAQVEVRNELLNYRSQYTEIDAQYNTIKAERAKLSKQIKACEKRINQIDNAKEKIRKNMQ